MPLHGIAEAPVNYSGNLGLNAKELLVPLPCWGIIARLNLCMFGLDAVLSSECFLTYVGFMLDWMVTVDLDSVACHHWRKPLQGLSCFTGAVRVGSHPVWLVSYNRRRFRHPEDANGVCAQWENLVRAGGCLYTMGRDLRRAWPSRYFISDSWPSE